ncbi:HAMP domain-containing protein [Candidatus Desantisbacteria bacterium]|nr:HAMP domain-containing protein [Candidatus Desantisbacteria bacterium]
MQFGIDKKINSLFILSVIIMGTILGSCFLYHEEQALLSEFDERAKALVNSLASNSEYSILFGNQEMLSKTGKTVIRQKDVIFCEIKDNQGEILFQAGTKQGRYIKKFTASIQSERFREGTQEEMFLSTAEKETKETQEIGNVCLIFSLAGIKQRLEDMKHIISLIVIFSVLFTSIAITLLVRLILGRPINRLLMGTKIVAKGNFDYHVPIKSNDEIGQLTRSFDQMTEELKIFRDKLVKSEKLAAASQIASEAAHEIKNPLAVIKAGIYFLKKILIDAPNTVQNTILQIDGAANRITSYIDDLLNFSKPPVLNPISVEINEVLEDSLKELSQEIFSGIKIIRDFAPELPLIEADPQRLKQVFTNLIKNASEAMKGNGELRIKSEKGPIIIISDTGAGISEQDMKHIFDPFFTTKGKGTGLGLAIVNRIIEAHKGSIEVVSQPGCGTSFIIKM